MQTGEGTVSVSRLQSDCGLLRRGVSQERVGLVGLSNSPVGLVRSLLNKEALSSVPTLTSASPLSTRLTYRSTHTDTPHANSHTQACQHTYRHILHTQGVYLQVYTHSFTCKPKCGHIISWVQSLVTLFCFSFPPCTLFVNFQTYRSSGCILFWVIKQFYETSQCAQDAPASPLFKIHPSVELALY